MVCGFAMYVRNMIEIMRYITRILNEEYLKKITNEIIIKFRRDERSPLSAALPRQFPHTVPHADNSQLSKSSHYALYTSLP